MLLDISCWLTAFLTPLKIWSKWVSIIIWTPAFATNARNKTNSDWTLECKYISGFSNIIVLPFSTFRHKIRIPSYNYQSTTSIVDFKTDTNTAPIEDKDVTDNSKNDTTDNEKDAN